MNMASLRGLQLGLIMLLCLSGVARGQVGGARVTASGGVSQAVRLSITPDGEIMKTRFLSNA